MYTTSMQDKVFDHRKIEAKWKAKWSEDKIYEPDLKNSKKPFYNLMMYPYPSAEGLHVGNVYAFTGADVYGRFKRMCGYDVFEPIGLDGFGIHSENYAIKVGRHPKEHAKISEENFYRQLAMIGNGFAWDHRLETYDPEYYKWTQWLFLKMFEKGLAYKGKAWVNWCPSCKTVLADEQVIDGKCERCKNEVGRREMSSWYFGITRYADRLLKNIDGEKKPGEKQPVAPVAKDYNPEKEGLRWPEKIKSAQRTWIGKKEGINITYPIEGTDATLTCFTTRPDTNFGATFIVVAPEYVKNIESLIPEEYKIDVSKYVEVSLNKTEQQRKEEGREKTGVFTGLYAVNQLNEYKMPIFVSDFVLMDVGTGAVVGVPGHDLRDFEFASKFKLPVKIVVRKEVDIARSYLMGGDDITDRELEKMGIKITDKTDKGYKKLEIPVQVLPKYEKLIEQKLEPGYWNEYIGNDVVFIFKHKNGDIKRLVLNNNTEEEIDKLANDFVGESLSGEIVSVWRWLAENDWYTPVIIQEDEGTIINSEFLDGLDIHQATTSMMDHLESRGWGVRTYHYHLRDWLISRQRYWGAPIPMTYCKTCNTKGKGAREELPGWYPVSESDLPVVLPDVEDFKPKGDGTSPLANASDDWKSVKCPGCGGDAIRELDVSDTFLDSSWYFLGYPNLGTSEWDSDDSFLNPEITKAWLPVDAYIGGAEHAVLHLLYSRFVTMVLNEMGYLDFSEPFPFLFGHGLLIKDGAKMSKSRGNIVVPDEYIEKYGSDALRTYLMFLGPYDFGGDFRDTGMEGMVRFVKRVWNVSFKDTPKLSKEEENKLLTTMHQTIKKVSNEIDNFRYNTAIASIMEYVNFLTATKGEGIEEGADNIWNDAINNLALLIAPFMPHLAEEIWENLGGEYSIHKSKWPQYDENLIKTDKVTIAVQINGKLRSTIEISASEAGNEEFVVSLAKSKEDISKWLANEPKKVIFVPGKIVNFVI